MSVFNALLEGVVKRMAGRDDALFFDFMGFRDRMLKSGAPGARPAACGCCWGGEGAPGAGGGACLHPPPTSRVYFTHALAPLSLSLFSTVRPHTHATIHTHTHTHIHRHTPGQALVQAVLRGLHQAAGRRGLCALRLRVASQDGGRGRHQAAGPPLAVVAAECVAAAPPPLFLFAPGARRRPPHPS